VLYLRLIDSIEKVLGSEHKETLFTKSRYTCILGGSGRLKEAAILQKEIASAATRALKPADSALLEYYKQHMLTLESLERYNKCLKVSTELIRLAKIASKDDYPAILDYEIFQIVILQSLERFQEAMGLARGVLSTAEKTSNKDQLTLVRSQYAYTSSSEFGSRHKGAEEFYKIAISGLEQIMSPDSERLLKVQEDRARNLSNIGQLEGRKKLQQKPRSGVCWIRNSLMQSSEDNKWISEDKDN
jgi:hypothetical protein